MDFCVKCGATLENGAKFCTSCGATADGAADGKAAAGKSAAQPSEAMGEKGPSAATILNKTKTFVVVRALAYLAIMLAMIIVGAIGCLMIYALRNVPIAAFIVFIIIIFGGFFGLLRLARRYFLYMIKAAHVAAITEFIKTGEAPVTEGGYKGVIAYGTEKITRNFKEANIAFVADALIAGATRQIMRWVNKIQNLFSFIHGADKAMQFVNFILSTALNYIDEAVLSYVFFHTVETNGFKKACDGLVYYAQIWKGMLKGALKVAAFVWVLRIVTFLIFFLIFMALGNTMFSPSIAAVFGILFAFIILYGIEAIIVVPCATCVIINDYYKAIEGQPLKSDLHGTLCKVSKKFRNLFSKSNQPMPAEPAAMPTTL